MIKKEEERRSLLHLLFVLEIASESVVVDAFAFIKALFAYPGLLYDTLCILERKNGEKGITMDHFSHHCASQQDDLE